MTVFNTVAKIGRRFASELNDIVSILLENSKSGDNITIQAVGRSRYNTVNKIKRRTVSDLQGLNLSIVQESFRERNTWLNNFRTRKPLRTYKNKIKLIFKYSNKTKY